jgi:PAS domain S-box-containing protein
MQEKQNRHAIINNTDDIIWSIDRQFKIISANEAFWNRLYSLTGKSREEVTESDFAKDLFSQWTEYFNRSFSGEAYKIIFDEARDGEIFYAEISFNPIRNEEHEVVGISCFSRDITVAKKMEEKIITDDLNLKGMIDNTDALIWSVDVNLNLITANQAYRDAIRAISGKILMPGESVLIDLFGMKYYNEWKGYYDRALSGERFNIEQKVNFQGTETYAETRFNPIHDEAGKVIGVSCFTRDITEIKQYAKKLEQQNNDLREIAWLQSHKVRSHVATILGLIQLINYEDPADEGNFTILHGVRQSSEELDIVIHEINDKTRLLEK